MKNLFLAGCLLATSASILAKAKQQTSQDSLRSVHLEEVQVNATRANEKTPITYSNLSKKEIERRNFGQDIPFLLSTLPSTIVTSDAGAGVGYTSIRIRGVDASRINITSNGIPMNDPESHQVFWVNIGDFTSSLADFQIQRGAGTSTNGAGAFGASINMRTESLTDLPYAEIATSYGSYNTNKQTVKFGTGLLNKHWSLSGRLSHIGSDGYRDRASTDLQSYFLQMGYTDERTDIKLITFGNKEVTYLAWYGISREMLSTNRRYNPNGRISDGVFYENQNDEYRQTHYQLIFNRILSEELTLNTGLYYTRGYGFYEEYRRNQRLVQYGLTASDSIKTSDLVRRKILDNHLYGGVFALNLQKDKWEATLGGGINHYDNDHYGNVIWLKKYDAEDNTSPLRRYYDNTGKKTDANIYARANYTLNNLNLYADIQYRHIDYSIKGTNERYNSTANAMQALDINQKFNFVNPKAGITWQIAPQHKAYASFAIAQREPKRKDFTDGYFDKYPLSERLYDYELGYQFKKPSWYATANLYYMNYHNQLVQTGAINQIGEFVSENVKKSYRTGIELSMGAKITPFLRWDANATWSKNRIKNYVASYYSSDYKNVREFALGNVPISFSPSLIANNIFSLELKRWNINLTTQYVSRQYLDNAGIKENSLNPYCISHLSTEYTFTLPYTKQVSIGVSVYNLFNEHYETNGYAQTTYSDNGGVVTITHDPRFFPMAGTNMLGHLRIKF